MNKVILDEKENVSIINTDILDAGVELRLQPNENGDYDTMNMSYGEPCCSDAIETALQLSIDSVSYSTLECAAEENWYKFTTEYGGEYRIFTTGDVKTSGKIFATDCCMLGSATSNFDDGNNFAINVDLEANSTYYVRVTAADASSYKGTYGIVVSTSQPEEVCISYNDSCYYDIYDTNSPVLLDLPGAVGISKGKLVLNGTALMLISTPRDGEWYFVYAPTELGGKTSLKYGWCKGEYLIKEVEYGYLTSTDNWYVREKPTTKSNALTLIESGSLIKLLVKSITTDSKYTWHQVLYNNSVGYVADTIDESGKFTNYIFISQRELLSNTQPPFVPTEISEYGFNFIKDYEDFCATAQNDGYGNLTIGYGHVLTSGENYGTIDEGMALDLLCEDISKAETLVTNYSKNRKVIWKQHQFDAFVSLAFNAGDETGGVMNEIIANEDVYAAFSKVSNASNGEWSLGLYRRRMDEADIYVKGDYAREEREIVHSI